MNCSIIPPSLSQEINQHYDLVVRAIGNVSWKEKMVDDSNSFQERRDYWTNLARKLVDISTET